MNFTHTPILFLRSIPLFIFLLFFSTRGHAQFVVKDYHKIVIDSNNVKWGDYAEPAWLRYFGVDAGDINGDGFLDLLTGRTLYLNPGNNMTEEWQKVDLGQNVDGFLVMDVDGDEFADLIAMALPNIYWFESQNTAGTSWAGKVISNIPATSHTNSQGYKKWPATSTKYPSFLIAGDGNVYLIEAQPEAENMIWKKTLVGKNTSDEGIGLGDLDGDGDLDIATGRKPQGADEPLLLIWHQNPGDGSGDWNAYEIGSTSHPIDRIEIGDVNGDGQADIIMAEERHPGLEPDGNIFWFSPKEDLKDYWNKNLITTQWSSNNLDVADMDADGDLDIITAQHKGPNLKTQIWKNDGKGSFTETIIDQGVESHLGTQVFDLDADGDLDIVSIGWDQYEKVHIWRNDLKTPNSKWRLVSSSKNEIETPNQGTEQTASLVADIDNNGSMDFFITERTQAPSVVLYRYNGKNWDRYIIENQPLRIEAGSTSHDIDGDGDLDIVFGGESQSNEVWWWENPYPNFEPNTPWVRRTIKKSGGNKHHDQLFGDFDGDGQQELAFWNQGDNRLILAEIPKKVKKAKEWPLTTIYQYHTDSEMEPIVGLNGYPGWQMVNEHEGLFKCDINLDGIEDIVGGGRWFEFSNQQYIPHIIDASYTFSRSVAGQFIEGGRPEVLMVVGDGTGPLFMYQWHEWEGWQGNKRGTGTWQRIKLIERLENGHTLEVVDYNKDGHLDLFIAEMRFGENNPDSRVQILLGNGKGQFTPLIVATGYGVHEGKIADLDGDGDYDILGKPYTWNAPLLNLWINENE